MCLLYSLVQPSHFEVKEEKSGWQVSARITFPTNPVLCFFVWVLVFSSQVSIGRPVVCKRWWTLAEEVGVWRGCRWGLPVLKMEV